MMKRVDLVAENLLKDIINDYTSKRAKVLRNNPFIRPAQLREEIYGKD